MTWLVLVCAFMLLTTVQSLLLERESRRLQWAEFASVLRSVDGRCRGAGWVLVAASFCPGWRRGVGTVTWRRGDETFVSPVLIDAVSTTRKAAHPW